MNLFSIASKITAAALLATLLIPLFQLAQDDSARERGSALGLVTGSLPVLERAGPGGVILLPANGD